MRAAGTSSRRRSSFSSQAGELADDEHEKALLWLGIGRLQALRYDGEAFWAATHRALDGPLSADERADAYSLLAFQTSIRSGMWTTRPRRDQIEEWADLALGLAADGSVARVRALLARVNADPLEVSSDVMREASELAERLGDLQLRSYAFAVRSHAAYDRLQFEEAAEWTTRRLELVSEIDDPDHRCEMYESAVPVIAAKGRLTEARRIAAEHWDVSRRLSAHHRLHSISLVLELADVAGDWATMLAETDRVVEAVDANRATPCVRNPRDLLLLALANQCVGEEGRARSFERAAEPLLGAGHERSVNPPRLRMAIVRRDRDAVRELVGYAPYRTFVWGPSVFGTWIDALLALQDYEAIEREAPKFLHAGTVLEPYALRALGAARRDDELLARALERFRAFDLDWHAAQTDVLLAGLP